MRPHKLFLITVLVCAALPVCFAADESLQAAILTQEMMMDIGKNGLSALGKFADAKNIAVLKKVAGAGGEMADVAERSLKILNAYNNGVRGDELKEMVTLEIGDYAYSKLKSKTMDYIKKHVTSVEQLTAAYDLLGTLHDSSYYIVYIGMSIGLDMMDPETARKLEQSKFTKAAEKVTELTNKVMNDAKAGAEEIKEKFLAETEGTFIETFASSVTGWTSKIWNDAKEGAKDLGGRISDWLFGPRKPDTPQPETPSGDDVVSTTESPGGDQIVSGQNGGNGGNDENVCPVTDGNTPSGDFFTPGSGDTGTGGDAVCQPGDDTAVGTDENQYPTSSQAWENKDVSAGGNMPDSRGAFANLLGGHSLPDFTSLMDNLADQAAIVGPNLPHYRLLWFFSGESLANQGRSLLQNPSAILGDMRKYINEMKEEIKKITGI